MGTCNLPRGARPTKVTLNKDDLITNGVAISASDYTIIGKKQVSAGQVMGFGFAADGSRLIGTIYFTPKTSAPAAIAGYVRLVHADANLNRRHVVWEGRTDDLSNGQTDPRLRAGLQAAEPCVPEDGYLILEMKADSAATISKTDSTILVDAYRFYL